MAQQQKLILPQDPAERTLEKVKEAQEATKTNNFLSELLDMLHMMGMGLLNSGRFKEVAYRSRDQQSVQLRYVDEYGSVQSLARNEHFRVEEHFTDDEKLVKVILASQDRYQRFRYFRDSFYAESGRVASQLEKVKRELVAQLREDDALRAETAKAIAMKL